MTSLEDIDDPTKAMNAALILFANAFQLTAPTNNNQRTSSNPRNRQIAQPNGGNQNGLVVVPGIANQSGTGMLLLQGLRVLEMGIKPVATTAEDWVTLLGIALPDQGKGMFLIFRLGCSLLKRNKHGFNFKLKNLTSWLLQLDKASIYDTDGSDEVHLNDNCYNNEIFNMFTQEEQYTDLLDPIPEPQLVPQNDNHVNIVNCNMRAINAKLKSELSRYKIQEQRIKISQVKYDKLEKCYQKSVYQEHCLTRKINALHLSSAKQITTLNDEISNLNKQLSKENSSISSFMDEKKKLKHDFKTQEDKFLDKKVDLEARIKDLDNILLKRDQTVQTMHMLNPKPDSFYHPNQKMALGYPNPSYLKKAQLKQKSLYNGNLLLEEHDLPAVYDSEETLELAQEGREKMRFLKKEIKHAYYAKINHLSRLRDLKGKSSDTPSASNTLDLLNQKLESKIVEIEFQVVNYEREISHLKTTYKNLFDSISSNRAHAKLHDLIYENAQLRARVFENTSESMKNTSGTSVTPHVDKPKLSAITPYSKKLHASMPSHSVPQPREFNVVKHRNVISPRMFQSIHLKLLGPQPKGNTRNARAPSASKSSEVEKNKFKEDLFTSVIEHGILQDSSEPSNDNPNVVNALREPFIVNQDLGNNSSQSPPQINYHCCYGCGDLLEGIFCHQCTCKLCGNGAHYGYNYPPKVPIIPDPEPFNNQTIKELPPTVQSFDRKSNLVHNSPNNHVTIKTLISRKNHKIFNNNIFVVKIAGLLMKLTNEEEKQIEEEQAANARYWKIPSCYDDDDDDYAFSITLNEPVNSLSMGDEHLDTILATGSDEFIKSSVEDLVPNPSESEGEPECDVPACEEFTRINETDCYPEEETHFTKRLLYDNSSPRLPEEFVSTNFDAEIESFSPSPIPDDDYDSERDTIILDELLSNDSLSLPEKESFHFDIPLFSRPPAKPLDDQEKSPDLLSHQGLEAF
nr:hypothetical protein [Tanacetum cinerariifolium]